METFLDFISFQNPNVVYVVLGMFLINASSALIGTFTFLRKRALIGDAVAHSLLPGICLGFMVTGEKNLPLLLLGAFVTGWLSTFAVDIIVNRSKVKQDAAIGIVLSTFFALGIVLLTYIQQHGNGNQAGLDHFLFGQAAAITRSDVYIFAVILALIVTVVLLFYRQFVIVSFNPEFAKSVGMPVKFIEFVITAMTVLAIAAGIQALGVILMSALIVTPSATARMWSHKLPVILILAVIISVFSGFGGAYVSYAKSGMPTGPWVVLFLSVIIGISILIAPKRGIVSVIKRQVQNRRKMLHENILKAIYQFHESEKDLSLKQHLSLDQMTSIRNFDTGDLVKGLKRLIRSGFVVEDENKYTLTEIGRKESRRIVRLHRLWEQYLLKRTQIDTDHVHAGAEAIEHVITPELEKELERELGIIGIPEEDY